MKILLYSVLFFLLFACQGNAQDSSTNSRLDVMATVIDGDTFDSVGVKFTAEDLSANEIELSPNENPGSNLVLSGTPYSKIHLKVPSSASLSHPSGKKAELKNIRLLAGKSGNTSAMEVLSPGECNELTVPESGQIQVRIGAKIHSGTELGGTYFGTLDFQCVSRSDEKN